MDWLDLLAVHGTLKSLLKHHSSKASILQHSAFFIVQLSYPYMTTGKTIDLTRWTFVDKVMSLLFNMLSRLVITFLPRSNCLLISWLQSPSAEILEPPKIKSATVSPSICHEVHEKYHQELIFVMWSCKPVYFVPNVIVWQVGRWLCYRVNMEFAWRKIQLSWFWRIWYREALTMWRKRNGILNKEKWWCVCELDRRDTTCKNISSVLNMRGNLY